MIKSLPLYERRRKILQGEAEPTAEEIAAGEAVSEKDDPEGAAAAKADREEAEKKLSDDDKAIKGKPHLLKFTLHLPPSYYYSWHVRAVLIHYTYSRYP